MYFFIKSIAIFRKFICTAAILLLLFLFFYDIMDTEVFDMKKPLILVFASNDNGRLMLRENYSNSIINSGGIPLAVPMRLHKEELLQLADTADGFLFAGGVDISPEYYGEGILNETVEVDPLRDELEAEAVPIAINSGKPVLGICRGIQSVNVFSGGSLYQDIPSQIDTKTLHRQSEPATEGTHFVNIKPGSLLHRITGEERILTNSFHHQCVKSHPERFSVCAEADDGVIEAMEGTGDGFVLLVQWHPEFTTGENSVSAGIFRAFVEACRS